jgi:hypothetical protein
MFPCFLAEAAWRKHKTGQLIELGKKTHNIRSAKQANGPFFPLVWR